MIRIPQQVRRFARVFSDNDYELFVVGGAVRDALLGKPLQDYDFATSATPQEVTKLFKRVIPTGIQHGTVTVLFGSDQFEVTTYRVDGEYSDQRHPDSVSYTRSLHEDLRRRDLTINAIALDPATGRVIDPHDGQKDLRSRTIRTVGQPEERFQEDALRMLRAVRFTTTLEFSLLTEVADAIAAAAGSIQRVASERIANELEKMMTARTPSTGWKLIRDTGLAEWIIPELNEDLRTETNVFDHLIRTCDCAPSNNPVLRWSALLHDIGKPRCLGQDEAGIHFHGHDEESARMTQAILERLRFSRERINAVTLLIRNHMFGYTPDWSDAAIRRFIARVDPENVFLLTALRRADICAKTGRPPILPDIDALERRTRAILDTTPVLSRDKLAVNGRDLMRDLKIPPGPVIGIILDELLQTVLDDPKKNDPVQLMTIAESFYRSRIAIADSINPDPGPGG